ncbi:hypothetical protein [Streptomyces sp. NPDC002057]|uniref:hypothetical protein n=1 Tax=Streptomyces sp. NPDC002057 TaxID=3154664 RepID=UPI0033327F42
MGTSARRLATLLPAMLCAIWSLLVLPAQAAGAADRPVPAPVGTTAPTPVPSPNPAAPTRGSTPGSWTPDFWTPGSSAPGSSTPAAPTTPGAHQRATSPEPHFAPTAFVRLPAAVENPVRNPVTPATTGVVPADLSPPARGVLAGDPRRERAPPGGPRGPRDPRGPPATRHS